MIGIVDYGTSNLLSLTKAIEELGAKFIVLDDNSDLKDIDKVIFPGIGSFDFCISSLRKKKWFDELENKVLKDEMPILGICIGYHILFKKSSEGTLAGLSWLEGDVEIIKSDTEQIKIPHMGWSSIKVKENSKILFDVKNAEFYFLHSYRARLKNDSIVSAICEYGEELPVAVEYKNLFGVQFHPEKSFSQGLKVLNNFSKI